MACAPTTITASRCASSAWRASSSADRDRTSRSLSGAPGLLISLHPVEKLLCFARATAGASHEIDGDLSGRRYLEPFLICERTLEDNFELWFGQHHVGPSIGGPESPQIRGFVSIGHVDHGQAGWCIGSPFRRSQGAGDRVSRWSLIVGDPLYQL